MVTNRPLYYWVLQRHRMRQLVILLLILSSVGLQIIPLELQKKIVNTTIPHGDIPGLLYSSALFFLTFILFGAIKFIINMLQANLGQTILFEIRQSLYDRMLQLPIGFFHTHPPGTVINALSGELSEVGHFIGGGVTVPLTIGLTLIAFGGYLFYLHPLLAAISLSIYPIEIILLPFLQKHYNRHNRKRIITLRKMSNKINESVNGIHEIHTCALYEREKNGFRSIAVTLLSTMEQLFFFKYIIKMLNNYFQNTGPFLLFIVGGYFAVKGELSLGALVACLSAYEKLYEPWKEIIGFYQGYQDAAVRYRRVMATFNENPVFTIGPSQRRVIHLKGNVQVKGLRYPAGHTPPLLRDISFSVRPGEHLAIVGCSGSGKSTLARVLAQLYTHHQGEIFWDGHSQKQLTKADITANLGYVGQEPYIFDGTVLDNILLPPASAAIPSDESSWLSEYSRIKGLNETPTSFSTLVRCINDVGLIHDIFRFALESKLTPHLEKTMGKRLVALRPMLAQRLDIHRSNTIERFDEDHFLSHLDLYSNLVFSDVKGSGLSRQHIAEHPLFRKCLQDYQLEKMMIRLGYDIAAETTRVLKDVPAVPHFFAPTPVSYHDMDRYHRIAGRYSDGDIHRMSQKEKIQLLNLALAYIPAEHKVATITQTLKKRILAFRKDFLSGCIKFNGPMHPDFKSSLCLPPPKKGFDAFSCDETCFHPYHPDSYLPSRTVLENLLFGIIKAEYPGAFDRFKEGVIAYLEKDRQLYHELIRIGLGFKTERRGANISGGQRQKIALVRALIKDPPLLILDEATSGLDNTSRKKVQSHISQNLKKRTTIFSVIHQVDLLPNYDKILVMKEGKIVENGCYHELMAKKGTLFELVSGP